MANPWIQHVKAYAKANGISYGCAISKAAPSYHAMKNKKQEAATMAKAVPKIIKKVQTKEDRMAAMKREWAAKRNKELDKIERVQGNLAGVLAKRLKEQEF